MDKRPHSRDKNVTGGKAGVGKGNRVGTGGSVGGGGRPSSEGRQSSGGSRASGSGILSLFLSLPSGVKKILLLIIAVLAVIYFLRSCSSGGFGGLSSLGSGLLSGSTEIPDGWTSGISGSPSYTDDSADISVASAARDRYVTLLGGGRDTVTVMVYMCGTDLESKYGMATADLKEMMASSLSDQVNIIVETGGCKGWKTKGISNSVNQIYKVERNNLRLLEKDVGNAAMTDPSNLTDFIRYCKNNYEASRYFLILWDHGGGSLSGYGYDEKKTTASSMTLTKLNSALSNADCKFDFIGFDACLMATLETALVCNQYADYMIASEETEPGTGWYYTTWLNTLSADTSVSTVSLAKSLIDSYMKSCSGSAVTLSVTDLAELQGTVPDTFRDFSASTAALIEGDGYKTVSNARAGARQFSAQSKLNQVDLCDLAKRIGTTEAKALMNALKSCVKYNGSTISGANGLSIYFPYETTSSMNSAVSMYNSLGMDDEYIDCIKSFASLETGGQTIAAGSLFPQSQGSSDMLGTLLSLVGGGSTSSSSSPIASLLLGSLTGGSSSASSSASSLDASSVLGLLSAFGGRSMPENLAWVDTDLIASSAEKIAAEHLDPARIVPTEKNGNTVLSLTDQEWECVQTVEVGVYVDDGEGYIDLGYDNSFTWTDDGDLLLSYDGTWLTLDGHVCAYYLISDTDNGDGTYTTMGRIPCLLNGELVDLRVIFDTAHPYGVITGAQPMYENGETDTAAKGDMAILAGDTIQPLCDYYGYDGAYSASYELGEAFRVDDDGLMLADMGLNDVQCSVLWRLTDLYGNRFYTPSILFDTAS